jgi:hypothetical protein
MSGLTLGLLQLDVVDLEVLRRSGTPRERSQAARIEPVRENRETARKLNRPHSRDRDGEGEGEGAGPAFA